MPDKVIIQGSARNDGDTTRMVGQLATMTGWEIIDLNNYDIGYYDYGHGNRNDDYLALMKQILEKYDMIIFATPVYWFAMSGLMKVFFDRFTDLLTIEKDLGRKLRGKKMAAFSCSVGNNLGDAFWLPFRETARYLGMDFVVGTHLIIGMNEREIMVKLQDDLRGIG